MWSDNQVIRRTLRFALFAFWPFVFSLYGQQPPAVAPAKPLQALSTSSFTATKNKDGQTVLEIHNISYQVSGQGVPGRPPDERLLLRITTRDRQVIDEIGVRATVLVEAWPLGADPKLKPLYAATVTGTEAHMVEDAVWVVSRGVEETQWWSVMKLGNAAHLFDTYVPFVHFSISRETSTERYAGLDVPPDDARDARLKEPHVVGVIEYASADQVIREALLTCDDAKRAAQMRSFADEERTLNGNAAGLTLTFSESFPAPPDTATVTVPILNDDLDLARAKLPAGLHLAAWKR